MWHPAEDRRRRSLFGGWLSHGRRTLLRVQLSKALRLCAPPPACSDQVGQSLLRDTAHMQHCKVRMCSVSAFGALAYLAAVSDRDRIDAAKQEAIAVVARWRDALLAKADIKANKWAGSAGIAATTITRNMAADSTSTAKLENLHLMARAIGAPSVLDFLQGQANEISIFSPPAAEAKLALPSEAVLANMFAGLLSLIDEDEDQDLSARALRLAQLLPDALEFAASPKVSPASLRKGTPGPTRHSGGRGRSSPS